MTKPLKIIHLVWLFSLFANITLAQPSQKNDWHGVLDVGAAKLRLWLEIDLSQPNSPRATLDSIDQSLGNKMPVSGLVLTSSELSFSIPKINATYRGEWNEDSNSWQGKFKQGRSFKLEFNAGPPPKGKVYPALKGDWKSAIKGHPLIVTVKDNEFGSTASLASPDEGVTGLPISKLKLLGSEVSFEIPYASVKFKGELAKNGQSFTGKWRQKGQPRRTLTFSLQAPQTQQKLARPQMPNGDVPYRIENVTFNNPENDEVTLAGTLTIPRSQGKFPAAILISGSGPQDRDETFMEHKPFAVIADQLTRSGIAVLRYDDRGVNESTGNHHIATSYDFATDANAAFAYLSAHPQIDVKAIGMIGHSEGGLIAPIALQNNEDIAFIIMLAGPGINTVDLMLSQQKAFASIQNIPDEQITQMQSVTKEIMQAVKTSSSAKQAEAAVLNKLSEENLNKLQAPVEHKERIASSFLSPWYQYFIKYEPEQYFKNTALPILAFYGELDIQVTAKENYVGLKALLKDHKDHEVLMMPKMNHMFQVAKTGAMTEYRNIEQTMSPEVLDKMSDWINSRF